MIPTMLHSENGILNPVTFAYDGIRMSFFPGAKYTAIRYATQFAPLLALKDGEVEIDWNFYANAGDDYRKSMNFVLLAIGIITLDKDRGLSVKHGRCGKEISFDPITIGISFFHKTRKRDAVSYIERSRDIFSKYPIRPFPHELFVVENAPGAQFNDIVKKRDFNCNELTGQVIISDTMAVI